MAFVGKNVKDLDIDNDVVVMSSDLLDFVSQDNVNDIVSESIDSMIDDKVLSAVQNIDFADIISQSIYTALSDEVLKIISANYAYVASALDGVPNDGEVNIDAGGAK